MSNEQLENFEELGRRAVACKMWRWMPGMLAVHHQDYGNNGLDGRVIEIDDKEGPMWIGWGDLYLPLFEGSWPDLRDPATVGCLLYRVRDVWPAATTNWANFLDEDRKIVSRWAVHKGLGHDAGLYLYSTEAAALVAALEGAP